MMKKIFTAAAIIIAAIAPAHSQGTFPSGWVQGNATATNPNKGSPSDPSAILDRKFGSTRGVILERGASGWVAVVPSVTAGLPWVSNGTGADPAYQLLGIAGGGTNCSAASGTCLDNITGFGSTGLINRTGAGTYAFVSLPLSASNGGTGQSSLPLTIANGGTGQITQQAALNALMCTPTRAGDHVYWNGSNWVCFAGNNSNTQIFTENSSGVPAWATAAGILSAGAGISITGTTPATIAANNSMGANKLQVFNTAGGSGTITTPTGAAWAKFTLIGGGSGGAGSGTAAGGTSTAGGNTCINTSGAACTSPVYQAGGGGAANWTTGTGGIGGSCSGSGSFIYTQAGGDGQGEANNGSANSSFSTVGGLGGNAALGFGNGGASAKAGAAGANGSGWGSGGQGGGGPAVNSAFNGPGGAGGAGCIAFIQNPAASYTYAVANSAAGGTAGTSGVAGGTGSSGLIIAEFGFN